MYYYIIFDIVALSAIIYVIRKLYITRLNFLRHAKSWLIVLLTSGVTVYAYNVHVNTGVINRLVKLRDDAAGIVGVYFAETNRHPIDMKDLETNDSFMEQLSRVFFPFKPPRFSLIVKDTTETRFAFALYCWGWDNDDDKLKRTYPLEYETALNVFMDGDILVADSYIEQLY